MKPVTFLGALVLSAGSIALTGAFAPSQAATFSFSCDPVLGADCAGNEGGILDVTSALDAGSYLYTVKVNNTSLAAGITGIGFDFLPDFDASYLVAGSLSVVRADNTNITGYWDVSPGTSSVSQGSSFDGISLSFIDFDAAGDSGGSLDKRAIFNTHAGDDATISFRLTQDLAIDGALLRLQRTGDDGEGSLKLVDIPEPATTAALGLFALAGLGVMKKKERVAP